MTWKPICSLAGGMGMALGVAMTAAIAEEPRTLPVSEYSGGLGFNASGDVVTPALNIPELGDAQRESKEAPSLRQLVQERGDEPMSFIVALEEMPTSLYMGGVEGFEATSPVVTGEKRLQTESNAVEAYEGYLKQQQSEFLSAARNELNRDLEVEFQYTTALNGMAITATPREALALKRIEGVRYVSIDREMELDTDRGPGQIGAPGVWNAADPMVQNRGEGMIVGVIDSGINPTHVSLAESVPENTEYGIEAYDHVNPNGDGVFLGVCDPSSGDHDPSFPCNNKLIGAYSYVSNPNSPIDENGHGTHTATTAAGNPAVAQLFPFYAPETLLIEEGEGEPYARKTTGVAPRANVIAYHVCDPGCAQSASVAAVEQAIEDGVDVLNYSISGASDPYGAPDPLSEAWVGATHSGMFVASSAGNAGPDAGTVSKLAPWVSSVAANTHDRVLSSSVDIEYGDGNSFAGAGFTGPHEDDIIYGGDVTGTAAGETCADAFGGNPFGPSEFDGEIVLCDLGTSLFGQALLPAALANVMESGGGGVIYANLESLYFVDGAGNETLLDIRGPLPAAHILSSDREDLLAAIDGGSVSGSIGLATVSETIDESLAGQMASFSSRGPGNAQPEYVDLLKPDISAPGVSILAGYTGSDPAHSEFEAISGTSMASPHVAGSAALVMAARPDWTPMEVKSALMLTTEILDGPDWYAQGAGEVRPGRAVESGLIMHESIGNMLGQNPFEFGNPRTLNLVSMANRSCLASCTWERTVEATESSSFLAIPETVAGDVEVSVTPENFSLDAGEKTVITVTMSGPGLVGDKPTAFGLVRIHDANGPMMSMPIAAEPDDSVDLVAGGFDAGLDGGYGIAHTLEGGNMWLADRASEDGDDLLHRYNQDGSSTGDEIDTTGYASNADGESTAGLAYVADTGMLWHLNVGGDQCLHEVDPDAGEATGNTVCVDPADLNEGSLRGAVYDSESDVFFLGDLGGSIYEVDMDGNVLNTTSTSYRIAGLGINPTNGYIFITEDEEGDTSADVFVHNSRDGFSYQDEIAYSDVDGNRVLMGANGDVTVDCDGTVWATNSDTGMAYGVTKAYGRGPCDANRLNLAGYEVTGGVNTPNEITLSGEDGQISDGVELSLTYTTTGFDWLNEFRMELVSPAGTSVLIGGAAGSTGADPNEELDYDLGWPGSSGTDSAEVLLEEYADEDAQGDWTVRLYSTWNSNPVAGVVDIGHLELLGLGEDVELIGASGNAVNDTELELGLTVNTQGRGGDAYVEYGEGEFTDQTATFDLAESFYPQNFTERVDGLTCGTTYQYRAVVSTQLGDITGSTQNVSTGECPEEDDGASSDESSFFACSIGNGRAPVDPLMPLLGLFALFGLMASRRRV